MASALKLLTVNQWSRYWQPPLCVSHPGSWLHRQPTSLLRQQRWAQRYGHGGGGALSSGWERRRSQVWREKEERVGEGWGWRNGVLPPRRLSERITEEQQHQQRYDDDERSIPTIFFKAALLKYWTCFIIKKKNKQKKKSISAGYCGDTQPVKRASGVRLRRARRKADGAVRTSDSDHGSDGGGGRADRWVQLTQIEAGAQR